jgi:hypothetical protein
MLWRCGRDDNKADCGYVIRVMCCSPVNVAEYLDKLQKLLAIDTRLESECGFARST